MKTLFFLLALLPLSISADQPNALDNHSVANGLKKTFDSFTRMRSISANGKEAIQIQTTQHIETYTLNDVILADRRIANQKPSILIAPITGSFIQIKGERYQIRAFSFEIRSTDPNLDKKITFKAFIENNKLLDSRPRLLSESSEIHFFGSKPELIKQGIYYFVSLRKIRDQPTAPD